MIENRPISNFLSHFVLIFGIVIVIFPLWITFVAATHNEARMMQIPLPLWPGDQFFINLKLILAKGVEFSGSPPVSIMLFNSLIMALLIACGKISISLLSAFAIVYFRFPLRMTCFWIIFITLMLPIEIRIIPTFAVVANLGMLNNYWGLSIPLIASATATFMFRQVFLTIPDQLLEAARIDGVSPMQFFRDILVPMSRTNIAALFVILFTYGWNQYLWPLLITTDPNMYTIVMGISQMLQATEQTPEWHLVMMTALLAVLPPALVILIMQKLFVKGLTETEK